MFPFPPSHDMRDTIEQRRQLQKQRLRHRLRLQSRQIENVMAAHHLPVRISGGVATSQGIQFDLQTQLSGGWERLRALTTELRQALGVPQISMTRKNGSLQVAIAKSIDAPVRLLDVLALGIETPPETAVLGLSAEGQPVLLPFKQNHVLISGMDGAGKTSLLRTIAMSLALSNRQSQLQQMIIAPIFENNNAFSAVEPLTILPHLSAQIAYRVEDAVLHLAWLVDDMENRLRWGETSPAVVLMIDQAAALMEAGGDPAIEAVTQLLQRGAGAGIHLILSTSCPESDLLDAQIKANLPLRVAGQAASAAQAAAATGLPHSEAEYLLGQGDFLLVEDDRQIYFQAAYVGDYDLHLSLKKLRQNARVSILAQPYLVRPELSSQDVEPVPASFWLRNGSAHFFDEEE